MSGILNDKQIIDNTHIIPEKDGTVIMQCPLPDGDVFRQLAGSEESARKHIIAFCGAVRTYMANKEERREQEMMLRRQRRGMEEQEKEPTPKQDAIPVEGPKDPKAVVVEYYETLQLQLENAKDDVQALNSRIAHIQKELDDLAPVMKAWGYET